MQSLSHFSTVVVQKGQTVLRYENLFYDHMEVFNSIATCHYVEIPGLQLVWIWYTFAEVENFVENLKNIEKIEFKK